MLEGLRVIYKGRRQLWLGGLAFCSNRFGKVLGSIMHELVNPTIEVFPGT
jgi:hypothetical protein